MNEIQYARKNLVSEAAARVQSAEERLYEARLELEYRREQLQKAIDRDPASWHATPGILR